MFMPYYCAIHLKKKKCLLQYIFLCKCICLFFHECILQYKRAMCDILPDLVVHLFAYIYK